MVIVVAEDNVPCKGRKCKGTLVWKERSWTHAGEDPGHWTCIMCGRNVYPAIGPERPYIPKNIPSDLIPKKEEEIKILLKTASVREIVAKTGVAKATIKRIRDENFTEEERAELKKRARVKGRNKRELDRLHRILERGESKTDLQKGGQEIMTEEMQACTNPKCPKPNPQPIGEFNKNAVRPSGRESRCRTCTAQHQREDLAAKEKMAGAGRSRKAPGNGRRKRQLRNPGPVRSPAPNSIISDAVTLDAQLLRAVKKSAILDFIKNDLPRMVEEAFA